MKVLKIDGIGLYASVFAAMTEEQAVKEMANGGILKSHNKDEAWAKKAYKACVEAVGGGGGAKLKKPSL